MNFSLNPNKGLGPYLLGLPLSFCVKRLQRTSKKNINVCFNQEDLFSLPIVVEDPTLGLELTFGSKSQRLQLIRVDVGNINLTYGGKTISASDHPTTLKAVSNLFGPAFPGKYDSATELYTVEYGGACFQFRAGHSQVEAVDDIALVAGLEEERQPVLCRVWVFHGDSIRSCHPPALRDFPDYFTPVTARVKQGILFSAKKAQLDYYCHVQHVLALLGPPDKIFDHRTKGATQGKLLANCVFPYFYNYFNLGVSIMFDGTSHCAVKFILYTNLLDRPDFGVWRKCNFTLHVPTKSRGEVQISPEDDLASLQHLLGNPTGPMINSSDLSSVQTTKIYSYPHILLEFSQITKRISKVILFPDEGEKEEEEYELPDSPLESKAKRVPSPQPHLVHQNSNSSVHDWGAIEVNHTTVEV